MLRTAFFETELFLVQLFDSAWVVQAESLSLDQTGSVFIFSFKMRKDVAAILSIVSTYCLDVLCFLDWLCVCSDSRWTKK